MYLSLLKLNPRSRKAMTEARRPYELHRSIMRAFPGAASGGPGRVLFRLESDSPEGYLPLLVQSQTRPDWTPLEKQADFLVATPQYKEFDPPVARNQVLYFRLRANPTVKKEGKRLGLLTEEQQVAWLRRKAEESGFAVVSVTIIPEGMVNDGATGKDGNPRTLTFLSVKFEGVLRVTDVTAFRATLENGIGSAKGIGFGLLSIGPLKGR